MPVSRLIRTASVVIAVAVLSHARTSMGQFEELATKIPESANAAVLLDVERLLETPLAKKEGWKDKYEKAFASGLATIAPDTKRMILAAQFDYEYMKPLWEAAVADFSNTRTVSEIARRSKGTIDPFGDTPAVVLRDDSYCVQFGPKQLGVMAPANRQSVARWLRQVGSRTAPVLDGYLSGTLTAAKTSQIVVAFDLEDAIPPDIVRAKLNSSDAMVGKKIDLDAAATALSSVRGLVLEVAVNDSNHGRLMVHFREDPAILAPVAKALILEIMGDMGATIEDIESWTVTTEQKRIVFTGPLSQVGMRRVLLLIDSPTSALIAVDKSQQSQSQNMQEGYAAGQASLQYFKSVNSIREELGHKENAKTFGVVAMWIDKSAKRIDRLPILDVDPQLLEYGTYVSVRMRDAAMALKGIGINTGARKAQVNTGWYGDGNYSYYNGWRAVDDQRNAIKAEEKARGATTARGIAQELENETAKIRQAMVAKYKLNF